ncbi:hypothetical protein KI387_000574 [Taxus chinensis]|uniref:Uncharacterized protein n=1 Tax=Taxus chinensis TaxID=29808 RepID=A0AA38GU95_TAXCH|nr:hypothetical protein KI387_000574 [Taxus chinensis]
MEYRDTSPQDVQMDVVPNWKDSGSGNTMKVNTEFAADIENQPEDRRVELVTSILAKLQRSFLVLKAWEIFIENTREVITKDCMELLTLTDQLANESSSIQAKNSIIELKKLLGYIFEVAMQHVVMVEMTLEVTLELVQVMEENTRLNVKVLPLDQILLEDPVPRFRPLHRLPTAPKHHVLLRGGVSRRALFSWQLDWVKRGYDYSTSRPTNLPRCSSTDIDDSSLGGVGVGSALEERPPGKLTEGLPGEYIQSSEEDSQESSLSKWLYPSKEELPDDKEMSIFDHLEELRQRIFVSVMAVGVAMLACFAFSKDLIYFLEAPVTPQGVRFLQLSPGEFFFTTIKVSGYSGLLLGSPVIIYEIIAFVVPGLTKSEKKFLGPIVLGSSVLFYAGLAFSYEVLTPAALNFFVSYAEGVVESLWSIDQYFEFVLVLMFSTGLAFQVPVIQLLLGQTGLVTGDQMLSVWRYVVVGAVIAAAVLTPSTDPLTQEFLAHWGSAPCTMSGVPPDPLPLPPRPSLPRRPPLAGPRRRSRSRSHHSASPQGRYSDSSSSGLGWSPLPRGKGVARSPRWGSLPPDM